MATAILKEENIKRRQELGQFFTPREVVEFIYDLLKVHLKKDAKWQNGKYPSIIDPACGEGIFLKVALEKGITQPKYVFGADIDEKVKEKWAEINLLKSFGSSAELDNHFFHQDGLLPLPDIKFRHKKGGLDEFDLVVGNPPYGGVGVDFAKNSKWKETFEALKDYKLLAYRELSKKLGSNNEQKELFSAKQHTTRVYDINLMKSVPIEAYFVERFIQLCKPDGHIAIIAPDGILANENAEYIRKFVMGNTKLEASISLPRGTFSSSGTSAKTSILILTKLKEPIDITKDRDKLKYSVFLAIACEPKSKKGELKDWLTPRLDKIYECYYQSELEGGMNPHNVKILRDANGEEAGFVREEKDFAKLLAHDDLFRWDPEYYDPKLTIAEDAFKSIKYPIKTIGDFEKFITYGPIVVNKKFKTEKRGVTLINQTEIVFTGLDITNAVKAKAGSPWVIKRAKPQIGDLLLARSGVGGVGKNKITIFDKNINACVQCFVNILRLKNINPFYVLVFWKGIYGWNQIERIINGVGTVNISFNEIRSIKIPILPEKIQSHIESEYKKMSVYHGRAMEAKAKSNEADYKKNIDKAEAMLKDLIARTEAVIRGDRINI